MQILPAISVVKDVTAIAAVIEKSPIKDVALEAFLLSPKSPILRAVSKSILPLAAVLSIPDGVVSASRLINQSHEDDLGDALKLTGCIALLGAACFVSQPLLYVGGALAAADLLWQFLKPSEENARSQDPITKTKNPDFSVTSSTPDNEEIKESGDTLDDDAEPKEAVDPKLIEVTLRTYNIFEQAKDLIPEKCKKLETPGGQSLQDPQIAMHMAKNVAEFYKQHPDLVDMDALASMEEHPEALASLMIDYDLPTNDWSADFGELVISDDYVDALYPGATYLSLLIDAATQPLEQSEAVPIFGKANSFSTIIYMNPGSPAEQVRNTELLLRIQDAWWDTQDSLQQEKTADFFNEKCND